MVSTAGVWILIAGAGLLALVALLAAVALLRASRAGLPATPTKADPDEGSAAEQE